jgi:hypothetical protein
MGFTIFTICTNKIYYYVMREAIASIAKIYEYHLSIKGKDTKSTQKNIS